MWECQLLFKHKYILSLQIKWLSKKYDSQKVNTKKRRQIKGKHFLSTETPWLWGKRLTHYFSVLKVDHPVLTQHITHIWIQCTGWKVQSLCLFLEGTSMDQKIVLYFFPFHQKWGNRLYDLVILLFYPFFFSWKLSFETWLSLQFKKELKWFFIT